MKTTRTQLLTTFAVLFFSSASTFAQDATYPSPTYAPPVESSDFGFEGFYAGILVGGVLDKSSNYLTAPVTKAWDLGVVVGANYYVTDMFLVGVEVQANAVFTKNKVQIEALALARVGVAPSDDILIYAAIGTGSLASKGIYAFGGGVEVMMTDNMSLRGEVLGIGAWGASPDAARVTLGLMWHLN